MPSHPEALQSLSERLAHLIQQEGGRAKKQAFARRIGVKPQQLSRYLKGQLPEAPTLRAIAEVGQVSIDWLLTGCEVRGGEERGASPSSLAALWRLAQLPAPVVLVLLRVVDELDMLDVHFVSPAPVLSSWARRAPARLQKPRWSVAIPGITLENWQWIYETDI